MAPQLAMPQLDLPTVAKLMFPLMLRNVASDGFVFIDPMDIPGPNNMNPLNPPAFSLPGCIIAAPSFPADTPGINQDYVYNWTRDSAIAAIEIAAAKMPTPPGCGVQPLIDYVTFAQTCQNNATPTLALACYTIAGQSRVWREQSDGPALQTLAMMEAFGQLDPATQAIAQGVMAQNINYLLGAYQNQTWNLWEEKYGFSFFARSVQLRCFQAVQSNTIGIAVPPGTGAAITWLQNALQQHWNGTIYVSVMPQPTGYDPNSDIIAACIYGAVPCTDTRLLATAAQLRSQWTDNTSPAFYPINAADQARGFGPLLGRYPGDTYDGDTANGYPGGHPWALCSCNLAELYYTLANQISTNNAVPFDALSAPFFSQIGVTNATQPADAVTALQAAGDSVLQAVLYHSDHLELSEQFDGTFGFEKSVRDLTWSYAAFLSAVRAR
jgi:glucoamylase